MSDADTHSNALRAVIVLFGVLASGVLAIMAGCSVQIRPACVEQDAALATQAFHACTLKGQYSPQECASAAERVSCKRRAEK